jgi:hypothetical protein
VEGVGGKREREREREGKGREQKGNTKNYLIVRGRLRK